MSKAGATALCVGLLLGSYGLYERESARVEALVGTPAPLRKPLSALPLSLGDWAGEDIRLEEGIVEVAGADDYLSRRYRHLLSGEALTLYLGYYGRHRALVGHHPERCYAAFGWKEEMRAEGTIAADATPGAVEWPAEVYRFRKGAAQATVVSFYLTSGLLTPDRRQVDTGAHRAVGRGSSRYYLRFMVAYQGAWATGSALRTTGGLLGKLLPILVEHLPTAPSGSPSPRQE